ncbi:ABC transporter substrate-binding protein [Marinivivus vitaminiproducens]|uniref:ABC transporter substrate-binding protein n=1 Tax=Marinivivus vitaminiproducens TaxID=3035935 RepID=UPI0027AA7B4B|nr:ABC transporter substrate-binding protein [Geminicoccaceae bacterium SCSIO 64248]
MDRRHSLALLGGSCLTAWAGVPALVPLARAQSADLPPLAERLPEDAEVVTPIQGVGAYGGELRFGLRGSSDHNHILRMVGPQGLVRWDPTYTEVIPNVAKSFEVSPDGREFVFHLRRGMKWSDGHPFTAEDILFNVDDLVLNGEFAPTPPRYMTGGAPMKVEAIDDLTVRFTFTEPYGDFLAELASPLGQHPVLYAKHYCSQFHPKYAEDIDAVVRANNASDWQNLFAQKCGDIEIPSRWGNPDKPTLDPWVVKEPYTGGATRVVMVRNPYFWQVDTEGNQLPYIDQLHAPIAQDVESLVLAVIGGRIDFGLRHLDAPANRPVLAQNREAGDYRFFEAAAVGGTNMVINLNLTHKNPEMRELFNTKDFRIALSVGMNRQEIIDTALLGEGEPWQNGPFEDHPNYHERIAHQYLEYDPEQANARLDGIGLDKRGPDNMRLMASGRPLRFQIDVIPTSQPEHIDMLQIIARQWADIGVRMDVNALERTFFYERTSNSNDHDAAVWGGQASWVPGEIPQQIVPIHHDSRWGIPWSIWYKTGGKEGEEPPPSVKERMRLYDLARGTPDPEQRREYIRQIADIAADEFEVFSVTKALPSYGIVKTGIVNVPDSMPSSWYYPTPAPVLPQVWSWTS